MGCVTSDHFELLLSGKSMPELKLGRDLHQGDPLSPYLFIIIVDVLSSIISFHVENGDLSGVKLGQATNLDKSYLYFSANASVEVKDEVSSLLGINDCANLENYLGLPMIMCRSKIEALTFVKERVSKKVVSWKHNFLSFSGREILIKAVINGIPSYSMVVLKYPKKSCMELDSLISNFWWGLKEDGSKIH
ncbi:reverse transcriptase [Senna tora]|uniref:Reverse transcriptase n=1 Tax=Senna tora TaxID=362788 RepID=A0A834W176_9FABA|nr:reverse transcriptase [Senna tora]